MNDRTKDAVFLFATEGRKYCCDTFLNAWYDNIIRDSDEMGYKVSHHEGDVTTAYGIFFCPFCGKPLKK